MENLITKEDFLELLYSPIVTKALEITDMEKISKEEFDKIMENANDEEDKLFMQYKGFIAYTFDSYNQETKIRIFSKVENNIQHKGFFCEKWSEVTPEKFELWAKILQY